MSELARANAGYANAKPQLETHKTDMGVIMGAHKASTDIQKEEVKARNKPKPTTGG
jgi:hypothetical protein